MLARTLAATLVLCTATIAAEAQPRPLPPAPRFFPAEKFSTRPVQGSPSSTADPAERTQKQRWDERSRILPAAPK